MIGQEKESPGCRKQCHFEDAQGRSPTEREFQRATQKHKPRFIFVKGADDKARHPKMQALIRHAGSQLVRRRFVGITDLTAQLYATMCSPAKADINPTNPPMVRETHQQRVRYAQPKRLINITASNTAVAKRTAHRDLLDLIQKVLERSGKTGKGTFYTLSKRATNGPNAPSSDPLSKGP